jgi:outer membrane protein assembly factor BamD (BamD/ComL family)
MTAQTSDNMDPGSGASRRRRGRWRRWLAALALALGLCSVNGCSWSQVDVFNLRPLPKLPDPPENVSVGANGVQQVAMKKELSEAEKMLYGAQELRRRDQLEDAERVFHAIAENKKNPTNIAEEARFDEAECQYSEDKWPDACGTYHRLLMDFQHTPYKEQAIRRMYEIADYWLKDTKDDWQKKVDKRNGVAQKWAMPVVFNTEAKKPLIDEEGRALEALQNIYTADPSGPYAAPVLFLLGSVNFVNENYKESDHQFTLLLEQHPDSPHTLKALEASIIAKNESTGGSDYDARKATEARQLVTTMLNRYQNKLEPEQIKKLEKTLDGITYQQAEKDYNVAEFYRRQGKMGSAWFCYEEVRRRYPGLKFDDHTTFHELATKRMLEIHAKAEKELGSSLPAADASKLPVVQPAPAPGPKVLVVPAGQAPALQPALRQ